LTTRKSGGEGNAFQVEIEERLEDHRSGASVEQCEKALARRQSHPSLELFEWAKIFRDVAGFFRMQPMVTVLLADLPISPMRVFEGVPKILNRGE
jgi:hypothetical protein